MGEGEIRSTDVEDQPPGNRARPRTAPTLFWRLVLLCAGIRVGLELIGLVSLAFHDQPAWANALDMWKRWDAQGYLRIAARGYVGVPSPNPDDPFDIALFPFFPFSVHIVSLVVQNLVLSALIVSFAASVGAGYFLFRLVALDADESAAWRAVLLLFSFPTAYFLAAPFTEALFLFAVLASVYAARTGRWAGSGVAGALATGTRMTGIALAPALLLEGVRQESRSARPGPETGVDLCCCGWSSHLSCDQLCRPRRPVVVHRGAAYALVQPACPPVGTGARGNRIAIGGRQR